MTFTRFGIRQRTRNEDSERQGRSYARALPPFARLAFVFLGAGLASSGRADNVSFTREIRPILSKHCGSCHGADAKARKADLRLDTRDGLLNPEIVKAGSPDGSGLLARLVTTDPEEVMPPPDKGEPLSPDEVSRIRQWIAEGAVYGEHWAFMPIEKPPLPNLEAADAAWAKSPIDGLALRKMRQMGMAPAEAVGAEIWLRRASLDLTGLPPSLEEMDRFLEATKSDEVQAKKEAVERLLSSKAFGERMANDWLDVARYADTYGRHEDADCLTWPYRDWVIKAFNENLPFDQFITWQIAGDLLPNPTRDQWVATCFNRLPQQSNEAGSNPEEFRIDQVNDRVNTVAAAFLGLTTECSRCHDHKYDPITMRDFYSMSAFFNNIDELGLFAVFTGGVPAPSILLHGPEDEARLAKVHAQMREIESDMDTEKAAALGRFQQWLQQSSPPQILPEKTMWQSLTGAFSKSAPPAVAGTKPEIRYAFDSLEKKALKNDGTLPEQGEVRLNTRLEEGRAGQALNLEGDNAVMIKGVPELRRYEAFSFGLWVKPRSRMERAVLVHRSRSGLDAASRGFELILDGMRPSFALAHFSPGNEIRIRDARELPVGEWTHLACVYDGSSRAKGMQLYVNGVQAEAEVVSDKLYRDIVYRAEWGDEADKDGVQLALAVGGRFNDASFRDGLVDEFFFHRRRICEPEVKQMALLQDDSKPEDWFEWYLREVDPVWRAKQEQLTALRREENDLSISAVELMVMEEMKGKRRETYVLERGQFDRRGAVVTPDTPAFLPPFPKDMPRNRLGFAKWLTMPQNPLTARVQVNRLWQLFFGRGLVETTEDFGEQGRVPENPELLDWLASSFVESGWDVKVFCRQIVLSSVYAQSARPQVPEWLEKDPGNAYLARGPRHRLGAEQVRDLALAASGLLNPTVGGPSLKPYQPPGLWDEAGTQHTYHQDHGANLYRRSLYTFWRRTMPPANMTVFDAPTREFCKARRERTCTPMQALVLMNDIQFLEAARCLAESVLEQTVEQRVERVFRLLTSQRPSAGQSKRLTDYLLAERDRFAADPESTKRLLASTGEAPLKHQADDSDLAATTMMVRLVLSFSETTTKP